MGAAFFAALSCGRPTAPAALAPQAAAPAPAPAPPASTTAPAAPPATLCWSPVLVPDGFAASVKATPGIESVTGGVLDDSTGRPLPDVVVTVESRRCGVAWVAVTDAQGQFRQFESGSGGDRVIPNDFDCGPVEVRFESYEYHSVVQTIALHPDTSVETRARLSPNHCVFTWGGLIAKQPTRR